MAIVPQHIPWFIINKSWTIFGLTLPNCQDSPLILFLLFIYLFIYLFIFLFLLFFFTMSGLVYSFRKLLGV